MKIQARTCDGLLAPYSRVRAEPGINSCVGVPDRIARADEAGVPPCEGVGRKVAELGSSVVHGWGVLSVIVVVPLSSPVNGHARGTKALRWVGGGNGGAWVICGATPSRRAEAVL